MSMNVTDPVFPYLFAAAAIVMTILFIFCKSLYDDQKWEMGKPKRELNDARFKKHRIGELLKKSCRDYKRNIRNCPPMYPEGLWESLKNKPDRMF